MEYYVSDATGNRVSNSPPGHPHVLMTRMRRIAEKMFPDESREQINRRVVQLFIRREGGKCRS